MNIDSIKLIYFSPTHTTRTIAAAIAEGMQADAGHFDLTPHDTNHFLEMCDGLAVIGSPVYGGRLPLDVVSRLQRIKGNNTPAVLVVLYGNRAYEDALLELRNLAVERGFKPFAAAAFIGEHSYSTDSLPVAVGRPDTDDLKIAREFGNNIRQKIMNVHPNDIATIEVPGNFPYKERVLLAGIAPVTDENVCAKCGTCVSVCPTAAIAIEEKVITKPESCIRCCACIKNCSTGARVMEDERVLKLMHWLNSNCSDRKKPETYL